MRANAICLSAYVHTVIGYLDRHCMGYATVKVCFRQGCNEQSRQSLMKRLNFTACLGKQVSLHLPSFKKENAVL